MIGNKLTKKYGTLDDFKTGNPIFKDLVKNYTITESEDIVNINISISDNIYDRRDAAFIIIPNDMSINIDVPFKVTNSNADSKKGNVYTWNITKDKRNANIILSFDKNRFSNHIYILNIGISYVILLVTGIVIAVSVTAFIILRKINSINKI
jgi:hypothetical protein